MSYLQTVLIGVLLIALVKGQYDFNSDVPGNLEQDSYGNNQLSSDDDNDQEPQIFNRNAAKERFKQVYNRIRDKLTNYREKAAELKNELSSDDYSENEKRDVERDAYEENGIQGDESNVDNDFPLSDYPTADERAKRSFWRRLKGFGRKVGGFGKRILGNFLGGGAGGGGGGGGLGALAGLFGR